MADARGHLVRLNSDRARGTAQSLVMRAPDGFVMILREPTRTNEQNDKMWAMLSDISRAKPDGRALTPQVWKSLFMHSLDHEIRFEMALDGKGMVPIEYRSSHLTKQQMSDLIELIYQFGAKHDVRWTDPAERIAA